MTGVVLALHWSLALEQRPAVETHPHWSRRRWPHRSAEGGEQGKHISNVNGGGVMRACLRGQAAFKGMTTVWRPNCSPRRYLQGRGGAAVGESEVEGWTGRHNACNQSGRAAEHACNPNGRVRTRQAIVQQRNVP